MEKVKSPLVNRDYLYDNVKAFLIITVVIGHFASGGSGAGFGFEPDWILNMKKFVYVFHMPVFMVVSGRFAGSRINKNDWPKVFSKVMVPYISAQILMLLVCSIVKDPIMSKDFSFLNPMYGMWYMFNVAIYTMFTARFKDSKWLFPVSLILALSVGFALSLLYGGFHRLICYYPFFLFGYMTRKYSFDFCKKPWFRVIAFAAIAAIAVYVFTRGEFVNYSLLSMNKTYWYIAKATHTTVGRVLINAIGRYIMAFLFFFIILGIMPSKKTFFSYVGKYSIYVYVLHLFIVIALRNFDTDYKILSHVNTTRELIIYFLLSVILAFVLALKPVRTFCRPFIEPNFDLSKAVRKLAGTLDKSEKQ